MRILIQLEDHPREGELTSAFGNSADFTLDSLLSAEKKAELFRVRLIPGTMRNLVTAMPNLPFELCKIDAILKTPICRIRIRILPTHANGLNPISGTIYHS